MPAVYLHFFHFILFHSLEAQGAVLAGERARCGTYHRATWFQCRLQWHWDKHGLDVSTELFNIDCVVLMFGPGNQALVVGTNLGISRVVLWCLSGCERRDVSRLRTSRRHFTLFFFTWADNVNEIGEGYRREWVHRGDVNPFRTDSARGDTSHSSLHRCWVVTSVKVKAVLWYYGCWRASR